MNVVLFGATGMVGAGVLAECLDDARVASVLVVGRSACGVRHAKVREVLRPDLFELAGLEAELAGKDACFFCAGVSSVGMSEAEYTRLTFDLTVAAADAVAKASPGAVFCYVSGEGTDRTEKGRSMWARVKGRTENHLLGMPSLEAYAFRPGYIQPAKGVRSKTPLYRTMYAVAAPLFPIIRRVAASHVTTGENVGRAMIRVAAEGWPERVLENRDIDRAGAAHH